MLFALKESPVTYHLSFAKLCLYRSLLKSVEEELHQRYYAIALFVSFTHVLSHSLAFSLCIAGFSSDQYLM